MVAGHAGALLQAQAAPAAELGDRRQRMPHDAGRSRLVAGADPALARVVLRGRAGGQVGGEKDAVRGRVARESIERGRDLRLAGMGPDRPGEKEVEATAKDRGVEARIEIPAWPLALDLLGCEQVAQAEVDPPAGRLDAAIAAGSQEVDQPVAGPQASAAEVEDLRLGSAALLEQRDQRPAAALLDGL